MLVFLLNYCTLLILLVLSKFFVMSYLFFNFMKMQFLMVLITVYLWLFMLFFYDKLFKKKSHIYNFSSLFMFLMCLCFFMVNYFLMFFVFFEMSLIVMIFIILSWGYQFERLQASFYLLLYTLCYSLPFLMMIIFMIMNKQTNMLMMSFYMKFYSITSMLMLMLVFFVKSPFYFLHLWLPKAHVESMVSGSILLAAILLKMGIYGMMRYFLMFVYMNNIYFVLVFYFLMLGSIISTFIMMVQNDQKMLIAYSSVMHMTLLGLSFLMNNIYSLKSAVLLSVSHAMSSSLLFYFSGIFYKNFSSRLMFNIQGISMVCSVLGMFLFLSLLINFSIPPFLSFFSELLMLKGIFFKNFYFMILIFLVVMISCFYSLNFYNLTWLGKYFYINNFTLLMKEMVILTNMISLTLLFILLLL